MSFNKIENIVFLNHICTLHDIMNDMYMLYRLLAFKLIALIPKLENPEFVSQFTPLSQCNVA